MIDNEETSNLAPIKKWFKTDYIKYLDKVISPGGSKFYLINWPDCAWYPFWFFTIRGAECFHIYLWIAKDWSWTQVNRI